MISSIDDQNPVTLFPFFNILLCVIGVLLLISATVTGFSLEVSGITITGVKLQAIDEPNAGLPVYVEWDGEFLTVHPEMKKTYLKLPNYSLNVPAKVEDVLRRVGDELADSHFNELLACVQSNVAERYVVFLVRPNGFNNFIFLREYLIERGLSMGYEPIGQYWLVEPSGRPCL